MMSRSFELVGLDGSNPLGFLAALGTLVSLHEAQVGQPKLGWKLRHHWVPILEVSDVKDEDELCRSVADGLRGPAVDPRAEKHRATTQREMEKAQKAVKDKKEEIKKRRLRGAERSEAVERELRPLEQDFHEKRRVWLEALREAVPSPELALGKRIDCTAEEYRDHASALAGQARLTHRGALDMLAAFGSDACRQQRSDAIEPTPFCFITGSGHQFFLETAWQLMGKADTKAVRRVLFEPWDYRDEGLSMRWDPIEDRRYALMDRDPTASDNKPRTMWMANLLAYRALALFTCAPNGGRLVTAGWDFDGTAFTWPLWEHAVGVDTIRSLVQSRGLIEERPNVAQLRARGVLAAYRAQRISVGGGAQKKLNFTLARKVA